MPRIKIRGREETLTCKRGDNLLVVLKQNGIYVDNPCGGRGTCGKCKVYIKSGLTGEWKADELEYLTEEERRQGVRLACLCTIEEDIEIAVPEKVHYEGLTSGSTVTYFKHLKRNDFALGELGVAVDLGTTTVAVSLLDLASGEELAAVSELNAQSIYGLDVLSRITYEAEHGEKGIWELQKKLTEQLGQMLCRACEEASKRCNAESFEYSKAGADASQKADFGQSQSVEVGEITRIVVSGNCTMLHMLLGVSAVSIGKAPYEPEFLEEQVVRAEEIGLPYENAEIICLPSVSAYVGGDIISGAYVLGIQEVEGNVLLIDIGTNGEMLLKCSGRMFSCSCAVGPALEGMNIHRGMRAGEGAIEEVRVEAGKLVCETVGGSAPVGICGSGILAAVREFLRAGLVKPGGNLVKAEMLEEGDWRRNYLQKENGKQSVRLSEPDISVTQLDIRQVQLAKGALLSGIHALFEQSGISCEACDKVVVAGQFGKHLTEDSLIETGILPEAFRGKVVYAGNASLEGAKAALFSEEARAGMRSLAKGIEYFELGATKDYESLFLRSLRFPS